MEEETWRAVTTEMGTRKAIPGERDSKQMFSECNCVSKFPLLRKCLISTKKREIPEDSLFIPGHLTASANRTSNSFSPAQNC